MQFIDLAAQQALLREKIDTAIARVLDHGTYIMGPEVQALESKLADFCGAQHCVSCANGTDALLLALMALHVQTTDAVFVPSFTFAATAEVVPGVGATPIFVDINPRTYTMCPVSLERAIAHAKTLNLTPKVVIPVDLFGLPADYPALTAVAQAHDLVVIGDSAQGWGGEIKGRVTGTFGAISTTSFFPAKPLGCYGDGGALFTDDKTIEQLLDSLRVHGKGTEKYDNVRIGMNSRLDTLQAAILLEKLAVYKDEIKARNQIANRYTQRISEEPWGNMLNTPYVPEGYKSIWAQYTLRSEIRDDIMASLKSQGVPSVIYYPRPLHTQTGYKMYPHDPMGLPESERAASQVFSLPMHPYLTEDKQDHVIKALGAALH